MTFSEDQVIAMAPDAASVKSGKDLASASKWGLRCVSEKALWGECQGSGKLPYQTQIDLLNLAFKCSCPSRKFPCKHGLALLLMYARDANAFTKGEAPSWVTEWVDKRVEKAEKKAEQKDKPVDVEAQAKRQEARAKKIADGVEDLQVWVKDLVRNGLLAVPEHAYDFWQTPSKRMVDAQAPGLANMVRGLGKINFYGADWQYELLSRLSRIYLASEAYKNINTLSPEWIEEIKTLVGFNQSKDELMAQQGIRDNWQVLARTYTEEDQLTVERNWLYGINTGKYALLLQFIVKAQIAEMNLMPGTSVDAELVFYKGVNPYRVLVKVQHSVGAFVPPAFYESFHDALAHYSETTAVNPFLEAVPVMVKNVTFSKQNQQCYLTDKDGASVRIASTDARDMQLLAITGGHACDMFLLANERHFEPMGLWVDNQYIIL